METLGGNGIRVINRLQKVFHLVGQADGLSLPQIVVVGSQSAGKSSVLESIVGFDFLPRGLGIVTRCPLYLQLTHTNHLPESVSSNGDSGDYVSIEDSDGTADYPPFVASFEHKKDKIFTTPSLIRKEIEHQTVALAGGGKKLSHDRIFLEITSPAFIDLTLVDLPGLMKNPVGDQPADIELQAENLIMSYIKNRNALILAVTPMNADIQNSDSIKMAKLVDPEGNRTMVVLTKLDIMDRGTNARKEMMGNVFSYKLGIIGVTNRTQEDIDRKKSIKDHLRDERIFFESHYPDIAQQHGVPYLAKSCNRVLLNHIHALMPDLRQKLEDARSGVRDQLEALGKAVEEPSTIISQVVKKFVAGYSESLLWSAPESAIKKRGGGSRINEIFHSDYVKALENLPPLGSLTWGDVRNAIESCGGLYPSLFVPERAFQYLAQERLKSFKAPSVQCANLVRMEMEDIVERTSEPVQRLLDRFPRLRDEIFRIVREMIKSRHELAREQVEKSHG